MSNRQGNINYLSIVLLIVFLVALPGCSDDDGATEPADNDYDIPGWELVWQDEFETPTVDLAKWEFEVNASGGGNNELQYYTARPENAFIADSMLVITAIRETYTGTEGTREYTSARLRTRNRGDWLYGRFDIRAKLPKGQGLWPAIWMLPTDWVYGGWPYSGEIDIMELLGHEPDKVYGTLHYGGSPHTHTGTSYRVSTNEPDFSEDFHVFTLEWDETEFRWYVDGNYYQSQTAWHTSEGTPYPAPFDQRFHLLLNVAVGGNWPGSPDHTTVFPQTMVVDYVRVYKKAEE